MGLFSGKKKITVETSVVRVIEDNQVPDARIKALVSGIMEGFGIGDSLIDEAVNGKFRNFERMYRWAKAGNYFYGLPNTTVLSNNDGYDLVKSTIEAEVGHPITIDYLNFRPPNNVHIGWMYAIANFGYDAETNELTVLSTQKGYPVYLSDIVAIHQIGDVSDTDQGTLGVWGNSPSSGYTPDRQAQEVDMGLTGLVSAQSWQEGPTLEESAEIQYVWLDGANQLQQESQVISLAAYDMDREYYQVRYTYTVATTEYVGYWMYDPESGVHPALDAVYTLNFTSSGTYFPFVIFRREGQNRATYYTAGSEEYDTTVKLLKILGMDYQEMSDNIHTNPDIDKIRQAAMMMAVPINSTNEVEIEYLYRFFDDLYGQTPTPPPKSVASSEELSRTQENNYAVQIADADFRIVMSYSKVSKRHRAGTIGTVGTYTNSMTSLNEDGQVMPASQSQTRYFRHQVTEHTYIEVAVVNPTLRYDVYKGKGTVGAGKDDKLLIPLDYGITSQMPVLSREELYYRSLHLVFHAVEETTSKWYESSFFRIALIVVAVVITILTAGAGWQAFTAALAAGAGAAALALLTLIVKAIAYQFVISLAAKALGPDLALLLATVGAVYGGVRAIQAGGFGQSTFADNLMQASTSLAKAAGKEYQVQIGEYVGEFQEFSLMADAKWKELEEVNTLLSHHMLDPFSFIGEEPITVFGESPDSYFLRSVHAGNVGALGFDFVEHFVDTSLKLPSVDDTLGDTFNV